jgi:nucleoside-diphosphate-sugar epimerase
MYVLVTGATGRVGRRFVPRLLQHVGAVRVLARDAGRAEPLRQRGAEVVLGDLREAGDRAVALDGMDAVVHLGAAFRGVPEAEALAVNQAATVELAGEAGHRRFVLASTNLVYGPGRGRPAREDDELRPPAGAYPTSKAAAEAALYELHGRQGLGLRTVRLAFVYGEGDPHLAESMRWAATWPAHKRLQLVHHADVGLGLLRALLADGVDGRTYNLADDAPLSTVELHGLLSRPLAPEAHGRQLDDPWEGIVDNARARAELGWRPLFPSVWTARDAGAL